MEKLIEKIEDKFYNWNLDIDIDQEEKLVKIERIDPFEFQKLTFEEKIKKAEIMELIQNYKDGSMVNDELLILKDDINFYVKGGAYSSMAVYQITDWSIDQIIENEEESKNLF